MRTWNDLKSLARSVFALSRSPTIKESDARVLLSTLTGASFRGARLVGATIQATGKTPLLVVCDDDSFESQALSPNPYTRSEQAMARLRDGKLEEAISIWMATVKDMGGAPVSFITEMLDQRGDPRTFQVLQAIVERHGDYWVGEKAAQVIQKHRWTPPPAPTAPPA